MKKLVTLASCLVLCSLLLARGAAQDEEGYRHVEHPPYDGWFNNYAHPNWGGAETPLLRRLPPAYSDGVYEPSGTNRPNPMEISMQVFNGSTGMPSHRNRTAFLVFFGQQVVEEILDAQRPGCPPEYQNIHIPKGHPQYDPNDEGGRQMPFLRSRYDQRTGLSPNNPRQQINEISAYFDGGLVYGPNKAWADALRSYEGGRLATFDNATGVKGTYPIINDIRLPMANPPPPADHKLKPISRFYRLGNPRGNENPFLLTFGILWFRYHNHVADDIHSRHSDWTDERIFLEARKKVIAVHQKVVMYDWLPTWLNVTIPEYDEYNPSVEPGIAHVFQSAAMRFGHTLVPPAVYRRTADCNFRMTSDVTGFSGHKAVRTCNSFWNPQDAVNEYDIDEFLMGMASQITEREDNIVTPDLRGDVFGPLEFSRRDLMAINIQRGRDHGLPDYNTAREFYGLKKIEKWEDINPDLYAYDSSIFERLAALYDDKFDDIDIWPGGLLETTADGPGPLFTAIILDQFVRIRDGDRFWYENTKNNLYSDKERAEINSIRLIDVIRNVTNITEGDMQENPFLWHTGDPCEQPEQLAASIDGGDVANCTEWKTFDYFEGSEWSYALSFFFLLLSFFLVVGLLLILAKWRIGKIETKRAAMRKSHRKTQKGAKDFVSATEWVGSKEGNRPVRVIFDAPKKMILVQTDRGKPLRTIDLSMMSARGMNSVEVGLSADRNLRMMVVKVPKEYDLILTFNSSAERQGFLDSLTKFLSEDCGIGRSAPKTMSEAALKQESYTKGDRNKLLNTFFREIMNNAFKDDDSTPVLRHSLSDKESSAILGCELTKYEFADALSLKPNSMFVESMFDLVDSDRNGYISFREFLDMIIIFSKGDADRKAKLLFDMYDLDGSGSLSRDEFKVMLKSLIELANEKIEDAKIDDLVTNMFSSGGLDSKASISLQDFQRLLSDYKHELSYTSLNLEGAGVSVPKRENAPSRARRTIYQKYGRSESADEQQRKRFSTSPIQSEVKTTSRELPMGTCGRTLNSFIRFVENYRQHIFWVTLYTLVAFGIFIERAYYYSVEREHAGLRQIAGYGVTVTRGAASGMMFTYSCLLVTMCRNTITYLRETFLHRYIPFDGAVAMHKYIAYLALFFTLIHIIGHAINFYHISTQTAGDLICLFRNFFHATDDLPKFHRWCWNTLTGFTGVLLTVNMFVIYVFAQQYARRHVFRAFWITHNTYIIFFILCILHGAGRLVQPPFFHYFFLGPVVLFTIDKLISLSRNKVEIAVVKAELLPSDVTMLEFRRPNNFEYKSGQWVRIASLLQGENEYHPFTLSSAPHEENLTLHIRAVGPWTMNLRQTYDPASVKQHALPKIYLDGPYGEGHQDWYKYEVAVLVGGGIGVTPFASILKDIAHRSNTGQKLTCKKVYFLWVTRTQKQFEWMCDIIRDVEEKDLHGLVSVHIFITQFKQKFDIRTTMLYICEKYFQKISDRSLFTGLRSITHFGRPDFESFLKMLEVEHADTSVFGVFSCGPPPMTLKVESACSNVNKYTQNVLFVHHYENF